MPQLSLYLDDTTMELLKSKAALNEMSLSKLATAAIKEYNHPGWPKNYFNLYGSIADSSFVEPEDQLIEIEPSPFDNID